MKAEGAVKQEQIIEAALRRFSHFGVAKTTLTEVADDLLVTKQALSYYFHDKQGLVDAVMEKIAKEYLDGLAKEMQEAGSVLTALLKLTEFRSVFLKKYFMMILQWDYVEFANSDSAHDRLKQLRLKERDLVSRLFEQGMANGELREMDATKNASLLLETLHAFSRCIKDKGALPAKQDFDDVFLRQQEVTRLFYEGLKAQS